MASHCFSGPRTPSAPGIAALAFTAFAAMGLVASLSGQTPPPLPVPDRAQTDALARRAAQRLAGLHHEAEALAKQEQTLLVELRTLEVDREINAEALSAIALTMKVTEGQLKDARDAANVLEGEAERQRPDIDSRLVQLYKMGRAGYWRLLLDVDNLREMGRAYRTASALGRIDRDRIEEHRKTVEALARERAALESRASDLRVLRAQALAARAGVERAAAARSALIKSIDARRDLNAQLTGELEEAQRRLQASVAQMSGAHTGPPPASLALRLFQGALAWPADGVLMSRFGRQPAGRFGAGTLRNGIELSLAEGRPVRTVYEGTVGFADQFGGYGNLVIVDHGDRNYSLYGHLSSLSVHRGDHVDSSATLGLTGRNPAGNPALYFELRIDGKAVDPLQWLKRR